MRQLERNFRSLEENLVKASFLSPVWLISQYLTSYHCFGQFFLYCFNYITFEVMDRSVFDSYKYPSNVILNQSRFHPQSGINLSLHPFRDLNRLSYWNRRWSLFSTDSLLRFSGKKSPWPLFTSLSSSMSGNPRKCSASKPSNRMRITQAMRRLERANIL